jgi:hypothetical protein
MNFNFDGMDELSKRTGRGQSNSKPPLNLLFRMNGQINLENPKKATRGKDSLEGVPLVAAWGLPTNEPLTIRIKDRGEPTAKDKIPMEVFDLQLGRKKGSGGVMGQFAAIVAEDARLLADGKTVECNWVKVVEHEYKEVPQGEHVHSGMVSVGYLNAPSENGFIRQDRFVHFSEFASVIAGQGDEAVTAFRERVSSLLAERTAEAGGRPSAIIRLVNQSKAGEPGSVATTQIWLAWDKDSGAFLSPEVSVDRWLSNPDNAKWLSFVQHADQIAASNGVLEVWPVWSFTTAKKTAEREIGLKDAGKLHAQEQFSAPMIDEGGNPVLNDNNKRRTHYGLIAEGTHQVVQMQGGTDWLANQTWTHERFASKLYSLEDLPTANISPEVKAIFEANAVKRVEEKKLLLPRAPSARAKEEAKEPASEQGSDFGDNTPDPTGGQSFRPRI